MKFYLAGRYARRVELKAYAKQLKALGHIVTSSWLNERMAAGADYALIPPRFWREHAIQDIEDLDKADTILSFTEEKGSYQRGGGRHTEFGYALAKHKKLFLVGPKEMIFHFLPEVKCFMSFEEFLEKLNAL